MCKEALLAEIKDRLSKMENLEDRVKFLEELTDVGYCEHCGRETCGYVCQCWNDE